VCIGGRVAATPVPVQVHANARSTEPTLGSQGSKTILGFTGHNSDLVPHQDKSEIFGLQISVV